MSLYDLNFQKLSNGAALAQITLQAPRANALEPGLLRALHQALDDSARADVIVLTGGRNFSSGGDVAAFARAARDGCARDYALQVVPPLQDLIYRLVSSDQIIGVAASGVITGGSAGLLFAADLAMLSPSAFIQPYYAEVGFAPDGGWSALLPQIIGAVHALRWQIGNRRIMADQAQAMGLAQGSTDTPLQDLTQQLSRLHIPAARTAKRLIWTDTRLQQLRAGLDAETQAFLEHISTPETAMGMARFLEGLQNAGHSSDV